jgi:hypothetical protein
VTNSFETFTKIDERSSLTVSNCQFENLVGDSGAAFLLKNSVFEISDTVFQLTNLDRDPTATLAASYAGVRPLATLISAARLKELAAITNAFGQI